MGTMKRNPYSFVSEKYLAKIFFDAWMKSTGHRDAMVSPYVGEI